MLRHARRPKRERLVIEWLGGRGRESKQAAKRVRSISELQTATSLQQAASAALLNRYYRHDVSEGQALLGTPADCSTYCLSSRAKSAPQLFMPRRFPHRLD